MTEHPLPSSYIPPNSAPSDPPAEEGFDPGPQLKLMDEVVKAIRSDAIQMAIDARMEQIVKHGHDSDHDSMQPIDALPRLAADYLCHARDQIMATGERRNLKVATRNLARCAAMCFAGIDRLKAAIAAEEAKGRQEGLPL